MVLAKIKYTISCAKYDGKRSLKIKNALYPKREIQCVFSIKVRSILFIVAAVVTKQQGNAPYGGKSHQSVNYTADSCSLSTEKKGDEIKAEKTYQTPVKSADDGEN